MTDIAKFSSREARELFKDFLSLPLYKILFTVTICLAYWTAEVVPSEHDYDCDTKENDFFKNQLIYLDKFANGLIIFLIGGRSLLS